MSDPLAQFRRPGHTPAAPLQRPAGKQPYEAYRASKEAKRYLEIRVKFPDPAEAPNNAMITNVRGEWRYGTGFTLDYGNTMVVIVDGRNLTELYRAVLDWKVEFIEEFDPEAHDAPKDKSTPVITSITVHTHKPEAPPPVNQRH